MKKKIIVVQKKVVDSRMGYHLYRQVSSWYIRFVQLIGFRKFVNKRYVI